MTRKANAGKTLSKSQDLPLKLNVKSTFAMLFPPACDMLSQGPLVFFNGDRQYRSDLSGKYVLVQNWDGQGKRVHFILRTK